MTNEDMQLLMTDIAPRLQHKLKFKAESFHDNYKFENDILELWGINYISGGWIMLDFRGCMNVTAPIERYKPYLRPMSSMTKEECEECMPLFDVMDDNYIPHEEWSYRAFDWLNAHHFDYRGLIEKGLAIEAHEGIYEVKGGSVCQS